MKHETASLSVIQQEEAENRLLQAVIADLPAVDLTRRIMAQIQQNEAEGYLLKNVFLGVFLGAFFLVFSGLTSSFFTETGTVMAIKVLSLLLSLGFSLSRLSQVLLMYFTPGQPLWPTLIIACVVLIIIWIQKRRFSHV